MASLQPILQSFPVSLQSHEHLVPILTALLAILVLSTPFLFPTAAARALKNIPGPISYPVVGNMIEFFREGYHNCHTRWMLAYGTIYKYKMGVTVLTVADPDAVQQVGVRLFKTFHDRLMPSFVDEEQAGKALVFSKGAYWTGVRNAVLPLFHTAKLQNFGDKMHECAQRLVQKLERAAVKGEQVNFHDWANQMTLDVLGSAAFGVKFDSQVEQKDGPNFARTVSENLTNIAKLGVGTIVTILLPPLKTPAVWLLKRIPGTLEYSNERRRNIILQESQRIIETRRKEGDAAENRHDFLSMLTRAKDKTTGEPLSDACIRSLVFEFLGAGTDTTANTMSFAVFSLANTPAAEQKLYDEICKFYAKLEAEGVKDTENRPTYDELAQFPYVEQVVQETLRHYPTGAVLSRVALEDTEVAGIKLPKGVTVVIPVYAMHHNPAVFPEPDVFRPERFDPEEVAKRHPYAYIPFGLGPRMCIGHRFAMEEAKLALIRLYKRLTFTLVKEKTLSPAGELELDVGIVLKPKHGVWVVPHLRS